MIIQYDEFVSITLECKLNQSELIPFLSHYQSLGELLYYAKNNEDPKFIITNPQWLSDQLHKVITYNESKYIKCGMVKHSGLSEI